MKLHISIIVLLLTLITSGYIYSDEKNHDIDDIVAALSIIENREMQKCQNNNEFEKGFHDYLASLGRVVKTYKNVINKIDNEIIIDTLQQLLDGKKSYSPSLYLQAICLKGITCSKKQKILWDKKATGLLLKMYAENKCTAGDLAGMLIWMDESSLIPIGNGNAEKLARDFLSDSNSSKNDKMNILVSFILMDQKFKKYKVLTYKLARIVIKEKKKYSEELILEAKEYLGLLNFQDLFFKRSQPRAK